MHTWMARAIAPRGPIPSSLSRHPGMHLQMARHPCAVSHRSEPELADLATVRRREAANQLAAVFTANRNAIVRSDEPAQDAGGTVGPILAVAPQPPLVRFRNLCLDVGPARRHLGDAVRDWRNN